MNFTEEDPFDPKAVWLNAEHIRALPVDELSRCLAPFFEQAGFHPTPEKLLAVTPLIRERIKLLRDAVSAADFFFLDQLRALRSRRADSPQERRIDGDPCALRVSSKPRRRFSPQPHSITIRWTRLFASAATQLGLKAGPMFQPIRVAVCGRKNAPPLFETLVVLGRDVCLARIRQAEENLQSLG